MSEGRSVLAEKLDLRRNTMDSFVKPSLSYCRFSIDLEDLYPLVETCTENKRRKMEWKTKLDSGPRFKFRESPSKPSTCGPLRRRRLTVSAWEQGKSNFALPGP